MDDLDDSPAKNFPECPEVGAIGVDQLWKMSQSICLLR
jgi:hypothetical protein